MVLEARANAEKIGYPVVGEEVKDASDVVDYNINEEITKDASGVINANNQTTTGMATVIPGINAPKLIAETSITGLPEADGGYYSTVEANILSPAIYVEAHGTSSTVTSIGANIVTQTGPYTYTSSGKGLVFPIGAGYKVDITFYSTGYPDDIARHTNVYLNDTLVRTNTTYYTSQDTFYINANKGDVLRYTIYLTNADNYSHTPTPQTKVEITKGG